MFTPKLTRRLFFAAEAMLLAGALAAAGLISRPQEWHPLLLAGLLLALSLGGPRAAPLGWIRRTGAGDEPLGTRARGRGRRRGCALRLGRAAAQAERLAEQPHHLRDLPARRRALDRRADRRWPRPPQSGTDQEHHVRARGLRGGHG